MLEIHGEVEISKFRSSPIVDKLAEKYSKGLITPSELVELNKSRTFKHTQRNMLMNRFFDRLASAFSQAPDKYAEAAGLISWEGLDSFSYQNTQQGGFGVGAGLPLFVNTDAFELVPGLIGLGYGGSNLDVDPNNRGLESPFPHDVVTPLPYNYRNTYNTKEGGTAPILANRDYYILRCGSHWENTWESRDGGPLLNIDEVGLFMNSILVGSYTWLNPPGLPTLDFTQGNAPPSNKAFEILNVTALGYDAIGMNIYLLIMSHDDLVGGPNAWQYKYSWSEPLQLLSTIGAPLAPPVVGGHALISFSPRYDHHNPGVVGTAGSGDDFPIPIPHATNNAMSQLLARVVLTEPFQKSLAETLTVVWMIYFKRVT